MRTADPSSVAELRRVDPLAGGSVCSPLVGCLPALSTRLEPRRTHRRQPSLPVRRVAPLPSQYRSSCGRCYEALVPGMVPGGILVADNAINHQATLRPMLDQALQDERVDALIVPVGKGELVCRRR